MKYSRKAETIADEATKLSQQVIAEMHAPDTRRATNALRVAAVCREFVLAEPVQPLVARKISDSGRARYGAFPAAQTLLNHYGRILRIWKVAFNQVLDVRVPKMTPSKVADGPIAGPNYAILVALVREQKAEIDRLTRIIKENLQIESTENTALTRTSGIKLELIRRWVESVRLESGPLSATELGISVNRKAYPGSIVMRSDVLQCIEAILAKYDA